MEHISGWLTAHEALLEDVSSLSHYIIVHQEGVVIQPNSVLNAIRETLGWTDTPFEYIFHDGYVRLRAFKDSYGNTIPATSGNLGGGPGDGGYDPNFGLDPNVFDLSGMDALGLSEERKTSLVAIKPSVEDEKFYFHFHEHMHKLRQRSPKSYEYLRDIDKKLGKFCYTVDSLLPKCLDADYRIKYVYKHSVGSLSM